MATRYYTEEAYGKIKQTIEQIDNTDVSLVKDFFSDLVLRIGKFLKVYSVEQYQNDMQSWYNAVLDSHDTTISTVDNIFTATNSVDFQYQDIMDDAIDSIVCFRNTVNCLRDVISGRTSLAKGKSAANEFLSNGKEALNGAYDVVLTKMELSNFKDACFELVGDVLKLGAGFLGLLIPTTVSEYAIKCKKFLDTFTATLGDLGAMTTGLLVFSTFTVGSCWGMNRKDYLDFRFWQLREAQDYRETNSISDWLGGFAEDMEETLMCCPKDKPYYKVIEVISDGSGWVADTSEVVDIAVDAYDIVGGLKDSHDNIDEWINGKAYTPEEFTKAFDKKNYWEIVDYIESENGSIIKAKGSSVEIISQIVSDRTGIPLFGWNDPSKLDANVLKTASTLWSYGEKMIPNPVNGLMDSGDVWDVAFNKFKDTQFLKDVFEFARDLDDMVTQSSAIDQTGDGVLE